MRFFILLFLAFLLACDSSISTNPIPKESSQLIIAIAENYDTTVVKLFTFSKNESNQWTREMYNIPAVLGETGLAWGKGLHTNPPADAPLKKEGDGKSPAGVFLVGRAFGFKSPDSVDFSYPYIHVTETVECIDDSYSKYYNRIVNSDTVDNKDWTRSEEMANVLVQYEWGIEIEHNKNPHKAGDGSCIFLHIWGGADVPTIGCTAIRKKDLLEIIHWLDKDKTPLYVALTTKDYLRLKNAWQLPDLDL